ncbi:MFS transporter [Cupriavidus necator]|uniref:MFS transporter n=1 Tax=Cupriavidus necator TaxID=106590 RepID=UPI000ABC0243|nr:MFS transporter [Cupriavidus necator]
MCTQKSIATIIAPILLGVLITTLDIQLVSFGLPSIQKGLNVSLDEGRFVLIAYTTLHGCMLLAGGALGDRFGRRTCYKAGFSLFLTSSLMCAMASKLEWLMLFRAIQGVGAALLVPQIFSSINDVVAAEHRHRVLCYVAATQGLGMLLGPLVAAWFIEYESTVDPWRLLFLVNIPIGIACLVTSSSLPSKKTNQRTNGHRYDWVSGLLLAYPMAFTLILVSGITALRWSIYTLAPMAPGLVAIAIHLWRRHNQKKSVEDSRTRAIRRMPNGFYIGSASIALFYLSYGCLPVLLTTFLQVGMRTPPLTASYYFLPLSVAFALSSIIKSISKRHDWMLVYGFTLYLLGLLTSIAVSNSASHHEVFFISLLLVGAGQGIVVPVIISNTLSRLPPSLSGYGSGLMATCQLIGTTLSIGIIGAFFAYSTKIIDSTPHMQAYGDAFRNALTLCLIPAAFSAALHYSSHILKSSDDQLFDEDRA